MSFLESSKDFAGAVVKDFGEKTGLSKLSKSIARLGKSKVKDTATAAKNFDVKFIGDDDFRVKIHIPDFYRTKLFTGPLPVVGDTLSQPYILFPFTPSISQDYSANYTTMNPTHSNYSLNFYKNSAPGAITVSGKFSVQNDRDATDWIITTHQLRALTKMRFGADDNAGAPPPVCRFDAYGDMQYKNVPVVIQSFRIELPDGVDYFAIPPNPKPGEPGIPTEFAGNMVPTLSTISVTLLPMYSRKELLGIKHVEDFTSNRARGYL